MTPNAPCPNCGRLNRPGARYCASCQTPLDATVAPVAAPLRPGQLLDGGTYRVVRPLGKGGMGAVWLAAQTKAFDRLAVIKEIVGYFDPADAAARREAAERFEAEARTLGALKHPGIPDLYAYFSERGHNYLVMEYIEGPDLRKWLAPNRERLPGDEVLRYTIQICEVLEYLARQQPPVVHNDIKPGNIIVDQHSGRAVLVDFGTAKSRSLAVTGQPDRARDSIYGTVGYAAPERYRGRSEPRSDVYSLAATAYHLLTDDDPSDHPAQYPKLEALPPDLADVLRAALADEIDDRLTAAAFRQRLERYLGGLSGPLTALTFPDGDTADSRDKLVALAVEYWTYAAGLLSDGTLARWLRRTLHDAAAAQAAEAAVQQWPHSPDTALDAFIRQLDPSALPPGKMELRTSSIRLSQVGPRQRIAQKIEIANRGRGSLRGEIFSTQPWVKVGSRFTCPPGRVCALPLEIDASGLGPGAHLAAVTLTPVGGAPEVVAVQIGVVAEKAAPAIEVRPNAVDFGRVDRKALHTTPQKVTVTNVGNAPARVRVQGAPRWLLIKPETFHLEPGARQGVKLVGRMDKVQGRKQKIVLTFTLDGGRDREVEVRLEVKRRGLFG